MKALEPKPIDRERAKKDVRYFAENYLDITGLSDGQVEMIQAIQDGKNIAMTGGNERGRQIAAKVAIAMARHRGQKVRVVHKEEFIDVTE